MTYMMSVGYSDGMGQSVLCSEPFLITPGELAVIASDVFRWLDGPGIGVRLNATKPNQVVVTDEDNGVLFSAFRSEPARRQNAAGCMAPPSEWPRTRTLAASTRTANPA